MSDVPAEVLCQAAEMLKKARHLVVLTGAGISVLSGVPDFRSLETGLWQKDDPMQVASLSTFRRKPERFFDWLRPLAERMQAAQPNPAHLALARMEQIGMLRTVITQNIDGLHQRAGSKNVIEVHGSAQSMTCHTCRRSYPSTDFHQPFLLENGIPRCPQCGLVVKPDIVLFEETLPVLAWEDAVSHASQADVMFVVGSSLSVAPAGNLPFYTTQKGGKLIINTLSKTPLDDEAVCLLRGNAAEVLPLIMEVL
jgi:NAD-dependent deacetylase